MRRDVFIQNDSGGFSVLAADAVDEIIQDGREDDVRVVAAFKALLVELYGDDSMPVRIVVDEPLAPEEEAQWLARASWRIDTSSGGLLVMGGFDPDVLAGWKDGDARPDAFGGSVAAITADPGSWRVDVYAHVGSMNGRQILRESDDEPGAAFRRSHPGRAMPLWLAKALEFSGEEDPGFEDAWDDVKTSVGAGTLAIDTDGGDAVGFSCISPGRTCRMTMHLKAGGSHATRTRALPRCSRSVFRRKSPTRASIVPRQAARARGSRPATAARRRTVEIIEVWSGDPSRRSKAERWRSTSPKCICSTG